MTARRFVAFSLVLVFVVAVWALMRGVESASDAILAATDTRATEAPATPPVSAGPTRAQGPSHPQVPDFAAGIESAFTTLFPTDDPAWAWSRVDLDALRDSMPDNTFWTLAVPTDDPTVLAERREHKERMNRALGKVMSNTGTEADVRAYYQERERISSDYVAFASQLLDEYGDVLPERDRGLVALAMNMHRARLEEMPRHLSEALTRREAHAAAREAWLAEEALFEAADVSDRAE